MIQQVFLEVLLTLSIQKDHGWVILKMTSNVSDLEQNRIIQLLFLLSIYYGNLKLLKPLTSNGAIYLVGSGYRSIDSDHLKSYVIWVTIGKKPIQ